MMSSSSSTISFSAATSAPPVAGSDVNETGAPPNAGCAIAQPGSGCIPMYACGSSGRPGLSLGSVLTSAMSLLTSARSSPTLVFMVLSKRAVPTDETLCAEKHEKSLSFVHKRCDYNDREPQFQNVTSISVELSR